MIKLDFQQYVFSKVNDQNRQQDFYRLLRPFFYDTITQVLEEYDFATQIRQANAQGNRPDLIDIGSGSGFYLIELAQILQKQGLLANCRVYGIDNNIEALEEGERRLGSQGLAGQPVNFYYHNVLQPLASCPDLAFENTTEFDFISIMRVLPYLPQAQQVFKQIYAALKPGGIIYLADFTFHNSKETGWVAPSPMEALFDKFNLLVTGINSGIDISRHYEAWLEEVGAVEIKTSWNQLRSGENIAADQSLALLRAQVQTAHSAMPTLVARGLLTQKEADEEMENVYRQLNPQSFGQYTYKEVLARKPF